MEHQTKLDYVAEIETWRAEREAALRAPDSWLTLTGLFPLSEGRHTIGSGPDSDIILPATAPAHVGVIAFGAGQAMLEVTCAEPVYVDDKPVLHARLLDNHHQPPTLVTVGTVNFFIHHFSQQWAVRVRDSASPAIAAFRGCKWYPVQPEYRVPARFVAHAARQDIPITTAAQTADIYPSIGRVEFTLHGQQLCLLAREGGPGKLTFVLRDATSGQETYRLARFLTADRLPDDTVILDFNRAFNPPCAFSPYATCPLPPPQNVLPVRIEAGEMIPPQA